MVAIYFFIFLLLNERMDHLFNFDITEYLVVHSIQSVTKNSINENGPKA